MSASSSESEPPATPVEEASTSSRSRRRRSPSPASHKRKSSAHAPKAKRTKSGPEPAAPDSTRVFCLGKLENLFVPIFLRYPHLPVDGQDELALRAIDSLNDEEKQSVEQTAKTYAQGVETAMFDLYAEPDKNGRPIAAGRYKYSFSFYIMTTSC
jgi:hypothetical protein